MEVLAKLMLLGGLVILLLSLLTPWLKARLPLSKPLLAFLVGVAAGPHGLNVFAKHDELFSVAAMEGYWLLVVAIAVMAAALRMPPKLLCLEKSDVCLMLLLVMPAMWVLTSLTVWPLMPTWEEAMLLGAILTPTDPVVAGSLLTGPFAKEHVPEKIRHLLTAEAALNDGLAQPFVAVALFLVLQQKQSWSSMFLGDALWPVVLGALIGLGIGLMIGISSCRMATSKEMDETSMLSITLAMTFLTLGLCLLWHANGIVGTLVAGIVFDSRVKAHTRKDEERLQGVIEQFFTLPAFAFFGCMAPWTAWTQLWPQGLLVAVAVILIRRLPVVSLMGGRLAATSRRKDVFFVGWFGPLGASALYYGAYCNSHGASSTLWSLVTLAVLSSLIAHGVTATPLSQWISKRSVD